MEKYLRLLHPKSVQFDAVRVDHAQVGITAQDVLLAMSYAKLTPIQAQLIRMKYQGANSIHHINAFAEALLTKYSDQLSAVGATYRLAVVRVALIEFCAVDANYKPSCRNRAVFCGYSHQTVKNQMNHAVNNLIEDISDQFDIAVEKLSKQIRKPY